ncbi:phosphopentomutase [Marinomonas sp. SBI22]|uniref:phosphopentomutase n=1 Tax=unclassified Marinomonas TaxID=196814 RepID=UPI0007AF778B|nr:MULTISPECIES: phosphopentomutase [unclassified Marinomonas]KZM40369.1 phosphopentomutase [Marinomonas sp. SBI22]KZM41786.1 phosphopentomutase [Marinomonas sp. SBI8L]
MSRAIILMMDSFGVGAAHDAADFGDVGSDTFGHIAKACAEGQAEVGRTGPLKLPNLEKKGLGHLAKASTGNYPQGFDYRGPVDALHGYAQELSSGKDTPSGHWELAGVPVLFDWDYFPNTPKCFPADFMAELSKRGKLEGVLGECHASGTEIIARLGDEHMLTDFPIIYSSADSVLQIAAHEESFGLERLLTLCQIARDLLDEMKMNIGRVIARPFIGSNADDFARTGNRRDLAVEPPAKTVLNYLAEAGGQVISIGKIADIYAHSGITHKVKATGLMKLVDATIESINTAPDNSLIFPNFVDFDSSYGHRRDVSGYAAALEAFDARLPEIEAALKPGDRVFISADHGCDPTWPGTDHTREHVPVICFGPGIEAGADAEATSIGTRKSFADIGQSIASHLGLAKLGYGESFL